MQKNGLNRLLDQNPLFISIHKNDIRFLSKDGQGTTNARLDMIGCHPYITTIYIARGEGGEQCNEQELI